MGVRQVSVPVIWLSNHKEVSLHDQWDSGLFKMLFDNLLWDTGFVFENHGNTDQFATQAAIFMLPARHHCSAEDIEWLNEQLARAQHCILMLIGDEEAAFPWKEVKHPDLQFWVMMPDPAKHIELKGHAVFVGNGFKGDTSDLLYTPEPPEKTVYWSFAGQATHARRKQAVIGLQKVMAQAQGILEPTQGFTQGLPRDEYLDLLRRTQIAPCPSGPCTPDTFRFYEALEAGCFPIADATSLAEQLGYWDMVYGDDFPFPTVYDWSTVGGYVENEIYRWPQNGNVASAWWQKQKRILAQKLAAWCEKQGFARYVHSPYVGPSFGRMSVVITTSPTNKTADEQFEMLEYTLKSFGSSATEHFPFQLQTIIACDGVRSEQKHLAPEYHEYVRRICWKANYVWDNILPVVAPRHVHQVGLARMAMDVVDTPVVLMMEHDTPVVWDEPIDWPALIGLVEYGAVDMIRLHHEAHILPAHEHLMVDHNTTTMLDVPLRRTKQWSQRPHVASSEYYRRILADHFSDEANCFIEDKMHSVAQSDPPHHRLAIYHPDEKNIKRSFHTDGRGDGLKYDGDQVW